MLIIQHNVTQILILIFFEIKLYKIDKEETKTKTQRATEKEN